MAFDDFKHNLTFHSLCDIIQRKSQFDKSSRNYVESAEEFFNEILKSIDSILIPKDDQGYYFMEPPLKGILGVYYGDVSNISSDKLMKFKSDINLVMKGLDYLKRDASSFYNAREAGETFNLLRKFIPRHGGFSKYPTNNDLDGDD